MRRTTTYCTILNPLWCDYHWLFVARLLFGLMTQGVFGVATVIRNPGACGRVSYAAADDTRSGSSGACPKPLVLLYKPPSLKIFVFNILLTHVVNNYLKIHGKLCFRACQMMFWDALNFPVVRVLFWSCIGLAMACARPSTQLRSQV